MASLVLQDTEVALADAVRRAPERIGGSQRMYDGSLRSSVRAEKRNWSVTTTLLTLAEEERLADIVGFARQLKCTGDVINEVPFLRWPTMLSGWTRSAGTYVASPYIVADDGTPLDIVGDADASNLVSWARGIPNVLFPQSLSPLQTFRVSLRVGTTPAPSTAFGLAQLIFVSGAANVLTLNLTFNTGTGVLTSISGSGGGAGPETMTDMGDGTFVVTDEVQLDTSATDNELTVYPTLLASPTSVGSLVIGDIKLYQIPAQAICEVSVKDRQLVQTAQGLRVRVTLDLREV